MQQAMNEIIHAEYSRLNENKWILKCGWYCYKWLSCVVSTYLFHMVFKPKFIFTWKTLIHEVHTMYWRAILLLPLLIVKRKVNTILCYPFKRGLRFRTCIIIWLRSVLERTFRKIQKFFFIMKKEHFERFANSFCSWT